jgi:hypothetical protein
MPKSILRRAIVLMTAFSLALCAADPIVGTWVLDAKKSTYKPGPPPRSQTRVYRQSDGGITATVVTVAPDGKATTVEYPVNYDGRSYPVAGSPDFDSIQMTRMSDRRSESTLLHGGKTLAKAVREVSSDGTTLTITYEGTTSEGDAFKNVSLYEKR